MAKLVSGPRGGSKRGIHAGLCIYEGKPPGGRGKADPQPLPKVLAEFHQRTNVEKGGVGKMGGGGGGGGGGEGGTGGKTCVKKRGKCPSNRQKNRVLWHGGVGGRWWGQLTGYHWLSAGSEQQKRPNGWSPGKRAAKAPKGLYAEVNEKQGEVRGVDSTPTANACPGGGQGKKKKSTKKKAEPEKGEAETCRIVERYFLSAKKDLARRQGDPGQVDQIKS